MKLPLGADALDTNLGSGVRNDYAAPRVSRIVAVIAIIKDLHGRQTGVKTAG